MSTLKRIGITATGVVALAGLTTLSPAGVSAADDSITYSTPGTYTFEVPVGVTELSIVLQGAAGGDGFGGDSAGGLGGEITATVEVVAGETLQVNVGGAGGAGTSSASGDGGYNGGGPTVGGFYGGGGGGSSDIRRGGTSLAHRIAVAGGGGGGGFADGCSVANGGDGGGSTPTAGEYPSLGGGAAAIGGGGAGGAGSEFGAPGDLGAGGAAANSGDVSGGGGGGGYYGGGGGAAHAYESGGGGGGVAYAVETATDISMRTGVATEDGSAKLMWTSVPVATTTTSTTTTAAPTTTTTAPVSVPSGSYGDSAAAGTTQLNATAGGQITVSGSGWKPGSTVTVTMYSEPVVLGTAVADGAGNFTKTFDLPVGAAQGSHRIELSGLSMADAATTVVLGLQLDAPAPAQLAFTC